MTRIKLQLTVRMQVGEEKMERVVRGKVLPTPLIICFHIR